MSGLRVEACLLPDVPWRQDRSRWQDAETAGFAALWTYDHLSWRSLRDKAWYGAVPLLSAAATATTRVRLGMLVATPNFRHPVPFAKELMTLDEICGGRLDIGLGAGTTGHDATVVAGPDLTAGQRMDRFTEFVTLLDSLLRVPSTTWHGDYYEAVDARQIPGCVQRPRAAFCLAATGPRGLALAARHAESWVTYGPRNGTDDPRSWWEDVRRQRNDVLKACSVIDRDPNTLRRKVLVSLELLWAQNSPQAWDEFTGRLVDEQFTGVIVHWPRPDDAALPGPTQRTFQHIVASLA